MTEVKSTEKETETKYISRMAEGPCDFKQASEFANLAGYIVYKDGMEGTATAQHLADWKDMTQKWVRLMTGNVDKEITTDRGITVEIGVSKVPNYAATGFYIATLPFTHMVDNGKFLDEELDQINKFRLYYKMKKIPWERSPYNQPDFGHALPGVVREWLVNQINEITHKILMRAYSRKSITV